MAFEHTISANECGRRLDLVVSELKKGLSRRALKEYFEAGCVLLNGRSAVKGDRVSSGDIISFSDAGESVEQVPPDDNLILEVKYSDENIAIIEKFPGIPTHSNRAGVMGTVANAVVAKWPGASGVGAKPLEPGLVHRLDTGTSGLMVVALTADSFKKMRTAFSHGEVKKEYLAVVEGEPPEAGEIDKPLSHHVSDARRMVVLNDSSVKHRGKAWPAVTRFTTVSRHGAFSLVKVSIEGGVMHQVRVHLASLGFPVAGDVLYGSKTKLPLEEGFMLHASVLSFKHPDSGKILEFKSPMPQRFERIIKCSNS